MHDYILFAFLAPIFLSVLYYFAGRAHHDVGTDGTDIFRILPFVGWFASIGSSAFIVFIVDVIISTKNGIIESTPLWEWLSLVFLCIGLLYGIYLVTLRIRVDRESFSVISIFRRRTTNYRDIKSTTDKVTGRYRTFEVVNRQGKRVLRVTSSYFPDYDELVYLVKDGARQCSVEPSYN